MVSLHTTAVKSNLQPLNKALPGHTELAHFLQLPQQLRRRLKLAVTPGDHSTIHQGCQGPSAAHHLLRVPQLPRNPQGHIAPDRHAPIATHQEKGGTLAAAQDRWGTQAGYQDITIF